MCEPSGEAAASTRKAEGTEISIFLCAPVAASTCHKPGFQRLPSIAAEGPRGNMGRYRKIWLVAPGSQWRKFPITAAGVRFSVIRCVLYIHTCSQIGRASCRERV